MNRRRSVSVYLCLSLCELTARGWLHLCVRDYLCANKEHVCRFEWTHKWFMSILCVPRSECKPKLTGLCFAEGVGVEGVWQACLSLSTFLRSATGVRVCLVTTLVPKTKPPSSPLFFLNPQSLIQTFKWSHIWVSLNLPNVALMQLKIAYKWSREDKKTNEFHHDGARWWSNAKVYSCYHICERSHCLANVVVRRYLGVTHQKNTCIFHIT